MKFYGQNLLTENLHTENQNPQTFLHCAKNNKYKGHIKGTQREKGEKGMQKKAKAKQIENAETKEREVKEKDDVEEISDYFQQIEREHHDRGVKDMYNELVSVVNKEL